MPKSIPEDPPVEETHLAYLFLKILLLRDKEST